MVTRVIFRKKEYEVRPGTTILMAIEKLEIQPEAVIPLKNGKLVDQDEIIQQGDTIRLVAVISGG